MERKHHGFMNFAIRIKNKSYCLINKTRIQVNTTLIYVSLDTIVTCQYIIATHIIIHLEYRICLSAMNTMISNKYQTICFSPKLTSYMHVCTCINVTNMQYIYTSFMKHYQDYNS